MRTGRPLKVETAEVVKRDKEVIKLRVKGWTLKEIAFKFGITYGRVGQICRDAGVRTWYVLTR